MSNQKDKIKSSKRKVVETAGIVAISAGVGATLVYVGHKLKDALRWRPRHLEGEDLKEQIAIIINQELAKANRDKMDQWQVHVSRIFEQTLVALAEKYKLKKKENKPNQIVKHLLDRGLIEEKLKKKLCAVIEQRNKGTHEALDEEELRAYFQQFQDILPVLKERL